jgi:glycerophosphoryl diester phosphodiesterase
MALEARVVENDLSVPALEENAEEEHEASIIKEIRDEEDKAGSLKENEADKAAEAPAGSEAMALSQSAAEHRLSVPAAENNATHASSYANWIEVTPAPPRGSEQGAAPTPKYAPNKEIAEWTKTGLVAHAGGKVENVEGTNTIEAVEENYALGHRVFELDLNLTSDGRLVGIHDWEGQIAKSWDQFSSKPVKGIFTPTSIEMFMDFLDKHKDAYIITDTKSFDYEKEMVEKQFEALLEAARSRPELRKRIVVQVYGQDMYHLVNKIYRYPNVIYTLYMESNPEAEIVRFVEKESIPVVVMPPERANQDFLEKLFGAGAKVFIHTINSKEEAEKWIAKGAAGVYTDDLLPKDMEK